MTPMELLTTSTSAVQSATARGDSRTTFNVEGMHCANCAASVERAVGALDGVSHFSINPATAKASVEWNSQVLTANQIFEAIRKAGFKPVPLAGEAAQIAGVQQRRLAFKRIGVAGLGMMQTMMFVYALYAGGAHGVNEAIAQYLRIAGMLLTTPVLIYSGAPFFQGALRDLRQLRVGMDVPVACALLLAFSASAWHTLRNGGEVYYDSVTMFIFLLSIGRFAEMTVRQRSLSASEALARSIPKTTLRVMPNGLTERIPVSSVRPGDLIRVPRGAVIPVDAVLASSQASIDESLLSGESVPVPKSFGNDTSGGSINAGNVIDIICSKPADESALAGIVELLRGASAERPKAIAAADKAATLFSIITLALAVSVAAFWAIVDPARSMTATLAVLVVTCPCAFSLAIPATFAAATACLARQGLLVVKPDALERLARVDTVVLDKTGTLTEGTPRASIQSTDGLSPENALAVAAALERGSGHPLASAFEPFADPAVIASEMGEYPGGGIEGRAQGQLWRLGRSEFVAELCERQPPPDRARATVAGQPALGQHVGPDLLCLGTAQGTVATFAIRDTLSAGAAGAILEMQRQNLRVAIASGDHGVAVHTAAAELGISEHHSRMSPAGKLGFVRALQASGSRVLMLGDGINDGPVLAAAYVSCAMTQGAAIAQAAADLLLFGGSLRAVPTGVRVARKAQRIIRQNLAWALVYNVTAVPLAAAGYIPPWIAALGMSLSSLAVVTNAARLAGGAPRAAEGTAG
jgi:P-type Cu2+ transporter